MRKTSLSPLWAFAVLLVFGQPGSAQSLATAGDTGAQLRQTDTTWQSVGSMPAPGNLDAGVGGTFTTTSQGFTGINGPTIPPSITSMEAPKSGMAGGIPSGQFNYGFPNTGSDRYRGGYQSSRNDGGVLPPTATSSVDLNIVNLQPLASSASLMADSTDSGGGGGDQQNLPPPPGPGFQPMYQHGVFVGWYTPEQVALSQTDFPDVLRQVVNGPYYYGGEAGRNSILYELGDIPSPF